ncbi:hypothetical protein HY995_03725 [Candidatus Micrarchaeota archaeon]|nr:hypothetical protein [Candidatus Micrarchaeota archaeon]MBI5177169.1 hypothetical protein [Candidatus Micrarchaeota archaeon]
MGNVMVSLDERHELLLRTMAREVNGGKKGSLSKVIEAGIDELAKRGKRIRAAKSQIAMMKKGFNLGLGDRKIYETRGELYDRPHSH